MKDYFKYVIYSSLLFIIGFMIVYEFGSENSLHQTDITDFSGGTFYRFVYIGSSGCAISNNEEMHQMVADIKNNLKMNVNNNDIKFISTGISPDISAKRGIEYLNKTGPYDEVFSGAGWYNLGLIRYVWEDFEGPAVTPQIILTVSEFEVNSAGFQIGNLVNDELEINRYSGYQQIKKLHKNIMENNIEYESMRNK